MSHLRGRKHQMALKESGNGQDLSKSEIVSVIKHLGWIRKIIFLKNDCNKYTAAALLLSLFLV